MTSSSGRSPRSSFGRRNIRFTEDKLGVKPTFFSFNSRWIAVGARPFFHSASIYAFRGAPKTQLPD
jgi:hypothetical protein